MSEQANTTPTSPTTAKRSWRWLKVSIGIVLGVILLLRITVNFGTPDLELVRQGVWLNDDGRSVRVTNTGHTPVTIKGIVINERADCAIQTGGPFEPFMLKIGDSKEILSRCRIIRVEVTTDQGSGTYSF